MVTTPGMLVLDGAGVANTQIAASATGPRGSVMVKADAQSIGGGAQIASSTAGPGKGGDVDNSRRLGHRAARPGTANHRPVYRQRRRRVDHRLGYSAADEEWRGDLDRGRRLDRQRR